MTRKVDHVGASMTSEQRVLIVQAIVRLGHALPPGRDGYPKHSGTVAECSACVTLACQVTGEYGPDDDDE